MSITTKSFSRIVQTAFSLIRYFNELYHNQNKGKSFKDSSGSLFTHAIVERAVPQAKQQ